MRFRYSIKNLVPGNSRSDALKCEKALIIHRVKKKHPGVGLRMPRAAGKS